VFGRSDCRHENGTAWSGTLGAVLMRVELVRPKHPDQEWRIAVNGSSVVAFAGPGAEQRAEECYHQLTDRLFGGDQSPRRNDRDASTNRGASLPNTRP
jgi:hypothetical protein